MGCSFFTKYCYKWHPRKCIGLDVANLITSILKNGENGEKSQIIIFSFSENNSPSFKNAPTKTNTRLIIEYSSLKGFWPLDNTSIFI